MKTKKTTYFFGDGDVNVAEGPKKQVIAAAKRVAKASGKPVVVWCSTNGWIEPYTIVEA